MNKENYTPDGMHPEDAIYKVKTFINELQKVQEKYFNELVDDLNIDKIGEEWLFDYIYNGDDEYDGFDHYIEKSGKKYDDFIIKDILYNPLETFSSTDFGEFSPMMHMSSYDADIDTTFPTAFNDNEPISLGLEEIKFKASDVLKNDQ